MSWERLTRAIIAVGLVAACSEPRPSGVGTAPENPEITPPPAAGRSATPEENTMEQSFAVNAEVLESAWDGAEGRWRLVVRLRFQNRGSEVFELDKTTAGAGGRLRNSVFAVVADGAEVGYQGMMAKRAHPGPDGFFRIPPGAEQVIEVDVGQYYPVPEKAKSVTVQFDHFNHFSVDQVQLTSNVVAVSLAK